MCMPSVGLKLLPHVPQSIVPSERLIPLDRKRNCQKWNQSNYVHKDFKQFQMLDCILIFHAINCFFPSDYLYNSDAAFPLKIYRYPSLAHP